MGIAAALACAPVHAGSNDRSPAQMVRTVPVVYSKFHEKDADFRRIWGREAARLTGASRPASPRPTAFVSYVRDASGSLLTLSMLYAPDECGPRVCPFKILRDGRPLVEFVSCANIEEHRISTDTKLMVTCESRVQIPDREN